MLALGGSIWVRPASAGRTVDASTSALTHSPCDATASFWLKTRLSRYSAACHALDRARANLITRPQIARQLAETVRRAHPGMWEARWVYAHALYLTGHVHEAHDEFLAADEASANSGRLHSTPAIHLRASARAATLVGELHLALPRYRRLLLVMDELSSDEDRAKILIEASVCALFAGRGEQEALGYLRRAAGENAPLLANLRRALTVVVEQSEAEPLPWAPVESTGGSSPYWRLYWLLGADEGRPTAPADVVLPAGALDYLLTRLALITEPEQAQLHFTHLACEANLVPETLVKPLSHLRVQGECSSPSEGSTDDED